MLKVFRKNIKVIIWIIVLSFVAWGAGTMSVSRDDRASYAGSIHGKKISHQEYLSTFRLYDLLTRAVRAQQTRPSEPDEEGAVSETSTDAPVQAAPSVDELNFQTWQTLVLSRESARENITVDDEEVRDEIRRMFFGNHAFDHRFYDGWIQSNYQGRPRDFEEAVRKHLAAQKVQEYYLKGVPDGERQTRWLEKLISVMKRSQLEDYTSQRQNA